MENVTSGLLVDIIRSGSIAFIGCKITKALQEKEISEFISASGWSIVGIDIVALVLPIIKGIENFFNSASGFFNGCDNFMKGLQNNSWIGDFVKRGMWHGIGN